MKPRAAGPSRRPAGVFYITRIVAWITTNNTARPHSSLGYKTPAAYADTLTVPKGVILAAALTAAG